MDLTKLAKAAEFYETSPTGQYDVEAALALRAGDVMMRRGWGVSELDEEWIVMFHDADGSLVEAWSQRQRWECPLAALVETDQWLTSQEKS